MTTANGIGMISVILVPFGLDLHKSWPPDSEHPYNDPCKDQGTCSQKNPKMSLVWSHTWRNTFPWFSVGIQFNSISKSSDARKWVNKNEPGVVPGNSPQRLGSWLCPWAHSSDREWVYSGLQNPWQEVCVQVMSDKVMQENHMESKRDCIQSWVGLILKQD